MSNPPPVLPATKAPHTNHIFVDFENVREIDLTLIAGKPVIVHLVLGGQQKNVPVDLYKQSLKVADQVRVIEVGKSGKNALNFVLAYHIGIQSVADPRGYFHIVSRDTGFDALIHHLNTNHILARRDESFVEALGPTKTPLIPESLDERVNSVIVRLTKNVKNRPARRKTLLSQIHSHFQKKLLETDLEAIIQKLTEANVIAIGEKNEVVYKV